MQAWIDERLNAVTYLTQHPTLLAFVLAVAVLLFWINGRVHRHIRRSQAKDSSTGWTTGGAQGERPHETGIGTRDVLVLKRSGRSLRIGLLTLLFFGGGAAFLWFVVLPDPEEQTAKAWLAFAIMLGFTVMAPVLIVASFTRIEVSESEITLRRLFRPRQSFLLSGLDQVSAVGTSPASGVQLTFADGRRLRLTPQFQGYAQALMRVRGAHPDLGKWLAKGQLARKIEERNAR